MKIDFYIRVARNEVYQKIWKLWSRDEDGNRVPFNLSGATFESDVRESAGQGVVVASAVITLIDPNNGLIQYELSGVSMAGLNGVTEDVELACDVIIRYTDNKPIRIARIGIILEPRVTY